MLVLSRLIGQSIVIGTDVVVTVLDVQGTKVRLGVVAPPRVIVDRLEVRLRKQAEWRQRGPDSPRQGGEQV